MSSLDADSGKSINRPIVGWVLELYRFRELLLMITWRDIRIKYKQSIMGILWAVLMPLMIVGAGVMVQYAFSSLSGRAIRWHDVASISVKSIPWAFFVASIRFATNSLIGNSNLVTKIYMPREIFPLAAIGSQLVDLLVGSAILILLLSLAQVGLSLLQLWVPVLLLLLLMLTTGICLLVAAGSLFFRDVKYIVDVVLTFAIFFTPVFYSSTMFGEWAHVLMLNPIAPLLEALSLTIVDHVLPPLDWLAYSTAVSVGVFTLGLIVFKRVEPWFAECV